MESNNVLSAAARDARRKYKREYMRKWRAANPDRVKANNARYWEKKATEFKTKEKYDES